MLANFYTVWPTLPSLSSLRLSLYSSFRAMQKIDGSRRHNRPHDLAQESEFIRCVMRGHFVAFRPGGIIQHRREEIVETASQSEHGLTDVNQFRRSTPNTVTTDQPAFFAVQEHFEYTRFIAEDGATRNVLRLTHYSKSSYDLNIFPSYSTLPPYI